MNSTESSKNIKYITDRIQTRVITIEIRFLVLAEGAIMFCHKYILAVALRFSGFPKPAITLKKNKTAKTKIAANDTAQKNKAASPKAVPSSNINRNAEMKKNKNDITVPFDTKTVNVFGLTYDSVSSLVSVTTDCTHSFF